MRIRQAMVGRRCTPSTHTHTRQVMHSQWRCSCVKYVEDFPTCAESFEWRRFRLQPEKYYTGISEWLTLCFYVLVATIACIKKKTVIWISLVNLASWWRQTHFPCNKRELSHMRHFSHDSQFFPLLFSFFLTSPESLITFLPRWCRFVHRTCCVTWKSWWPVSVTIPQSDHEMPDAGFYMQRKNYLLVEMHNAHPSIRKLHGAVDDQSRMSGCWVPASHEKVTALWHGWKNNSLPAVKLYFLALAVWVCAVCVSAMRTTTNAMFISTCNRNCV